MSKGLAFIDLAEQHRRIAPDIDAAIAAVLTHGKFIMGPEVKTLESELSAFTGAAHTVSCASGTDALVLALLAYEVGPGDAVIVPTFTFAATAEAVALIGATPVFADIDPTSFNVDTSSIDNAIEVAKSRGLRPVGIIPVDLFGLPADYDSISALAEAHRLWILADGAQSLGGSRRTTKVGALAPVTTTSFFPAKPLGCYGDGGAIFCDDPGFAQKLRSLRVHGQGSDKYDNVRIGINGRLDTLQAAILLVKLAIFGSEIASRQKVASRYGELLGSGVRVPVVDDGAVSAWAQYTIRVPDRDRVAAELSASGVPTAIYYPRPLHKQTAYRDFPTASKMDQSELAATEVLSLPMHPYLTEPDQDRVVDALHKAIPKSDLG